jgi:hypothetical protein
MTHRLGIVGEQIPTNTSGRQTSGPPDLEDSDSGLREMGFEEPQILVQFASQLGEEIRGDGIAEVI